MKRKTLWLAETAMMLAVLIVCQAVSKPAGQIVTGTLVNGVLGVASLVCGVSSGIVIALLSPVVAFLLGIAPQILTVPAIMAGNLVFVLILGLRLKQPCGIAHKMIGCVCAAAAKFAVLYGLVVWGICHILAEKLLQSGTLKQPMIKVLTATFTWPQLLTALLGGMGAVCVAALLQKAMRR